MLRHDHSGENSGADGGGEGIDGGEIAGDRLNLSYEVAPGLSDPKKARQLRNHDVDRDAYQKAGDHRPRQQIRYPAELQQAAHDQHGTDDQSERSGSGRMHAGTSRGETGQRTRENRTDCGVGPGRYQAACAERGEADSRADERVESNLRRESRKLCCRHLFGDGDGGKR